MDLFKKLTLVQNELKAPKSQFNKFGKYPYRNCEDILEAVKPLLKKHDLCLTVSDEIIEIGGRIYVEATATIFSGDDKWSVSASAREDDGKKGFDLSQLTGSTSSYARKYALNGLFLIDDTKDADSMDNKAVAAAKKTLSSRPSLTKDILNGMMVDIASDIKSGKITTEDMIATLSHSYTVGDGAKAAIRGIK